MKKVISFSLWGKDKKYTLGAIENAKLAKEYFPDWVCRYYVGGSVPGEIITNLEDMDNTEIILMGEEGDWTGMFWRFYAASDPQVGIMTSRDCDSRLGLREKAAVDSWLSSDKSFHIMRDHPHHATEILGGMWGCRKPLLSNMTSLISEYKKMGNFWQVDQNFLREIIFPIIKSDVIIHDDFFTGHSFPIDRHGYEFVGQVYDENNEIVKEHIDPLKQVLESRK